MPQLVYKGDTKVSVAGSQQLKGQCELSKKNGKTDKNKR